jgi:hypothetical protein
VTITTTEDYAQSPAGLAVAASRQERAGILDAMAAQASRAVAGFFGRGVPDAPSNPLGWTETATQLTRLAAAERGLILMAADPEDRDPSRPWADLATARTPGEYETAFAAARKQLAGQVRDDAVDRVAAAAQACAAARIEPASGS